MHRCRRVKLQDEVRISKFLSYILRHNPYEFGLAPDEYGFCDLSSILEVVKNKFLEFDNQRLLEVIYNNTGERFQIKGDKIRARYGHSIEVEPAGKKEDIPDILYHGTARKNLSSILKEGLKSGRRKFVHLSVDEQSAIRIGRRHDIEPVMLRSDVKEARAKGVKFWREGSVVVSTEIPGECVEIEIQNRR